MRILVWLWDLYQRSAIVRASARAIFCLLVGAASVWFMEDVDEKWHYAYWGFVAGIGACYYARQIGERMYPRPDSDAPTAPSEVDALSSS